MVVHTLSSVYGETEGQSVKDEDWLALAGNRGWPVLMKDDSIRKRPAELAALEAAGVRAFCITNAGLTGEVMAERFVRHRNRIIQRCSHPGPFIDGVYDDGLRRLWPS